MGVNQRRKRHAFRMVFSLRTLLIVTIVGGALIGKASTMVIEARNASRTMY